MQSENGQEDITHFSNIAKIIVHSVGLERYIDEPQEFLIVQNKRIPSENFFSSSGILPAIALVIDINHYQYFDKPILGCEFSTYNESMCGFDIHGSLRKKTRQAWASILMPMRKAVMDMALIHDCDEVLDFTPGVTYARMIPQIVGSSRFTALDVHRELMDIKKNQGLDLASRLNISPSPGVGKYSDITTDIEVRL